jgi:preprotein translocase subunit YajC
MKAPVRTVLIVSILALAAVCLLSTLAIAQGPGDEGGGNGEEQAPPGGLFGGNPIFMMLIILAIFWFIVIMPQRKQQKKHQEQVSQLKSGDKVLTSGGIYGTVRRHKPDDTKLTVEIAKDVRVEVAKSSITSVVPKDEPKE